MRRVSMMERFTALLPAAVLLATLLPGMAAPARAQSREQKGREVAQEALRALGGQRFLEVKDRMESGRVYSFYRERLAGLAKAILWTRYLTPAAAPVPGEVYVRERTSYGASKEDKRGEDYAVLFDETKGYQITFRGARPIAEDLLTRYRDTVTRNIFYILRLRLNEPGLLIEHDGAEVFENTPVEKVTITDSANNSVQVMFHRSTKLPVRQVFIRRDRERQRHEEVTRFDKFRDVGGGVLWPHVIQRERDGERIFEIFSDQVAINQNLSDELFTLSANLKILPLAR